ncbi:MAG: hypothetical protein RR875_08100, partial [Clostridium sp.]
MKTILRKIRHEYRRTLAAFMSVVLTMTSFTMVSWADVKTAITNENAIFYVTGESITEAAQAAIDGGETVVFENLGIDAKDKSLLKDYTKLFTEGAVYELFPNCNMADDASIDGAEVRTFIRANDTAEGYQLAGDEEIIFLYENNSNSRVTFRMNVDGYMTPKTTVSANSSLIKIEEP